jgi:nucleoid-associated protein YgaU
MKRYQYITTTRTEENPNPRYITTKYPKISLDFSDIYVYTTRGDRYDLLAQSYYGDSSLWWIISRANPSQTSDSLLPNPGEQIRIPASFKVPIILSQYDALNQNV